MYTSSVCWARAGALPPQPVDQEIARHRLVRAQNKNRQQRPLLLAPDVEDTAVDAGLNRPQ
jgi:hypothetical protein